MDLSIESLLTYSTLLRHFLLNGHLTQPKIRLFSFTIHQKPPFHGQESRQSCPWAELRHVMLNEVKHLSAEDPSLALRMTRRGTLDDKVRCLG